MAHRLDGEIHKLYKSCLEEVSKIKTKKPKVNKMVYATMAGSRDEAVRLRHKHLALEKLLQKDGYYVLFFPEGDEMPKGTYDKALSVGIIISWDKPKDEDSDV